MSASMRPHYVALALMRLAAHFRAGGAGDRDGAVFRIIVVDVDGGRRQRLAEAGNDGRDRRLLVVAGHQHGNAQIRRRHCRTIVESPLAMERLYRNQAFAGCATAALFATASRGARVANKSVHSESIAIGTV